MVSLEAVRYCATVLLVSIPVLHAYSHGSHPRCTKIPASDVYQGTCYFQFVSGKGYVRKACPSGTRYSQDDCDCIGGIQRSKNTEVAAPYDNGDAVKASPSRSTPSFLHMLFRNSPFSIMKFLFDHDREDRERHDDFAENRGRDEQEGSDGEYREADDFDRFQFYGSESESESESPKFGHDDRSKSSNVYPSHVTSREESSDDGNEGVGASHYYAGQARRGFSGFDDDDYMSRYPTEDREDRDRYSHNRHGIFFDKAGDYANSQDKRVSLRGSGGHMDDDDADDHGDDDNDVDNGANIKHLYKHGYGSAYSVKGMLSRSKQYRYEDLFVNLFDDNGDDGSKSDDDDNDDDDDDDDDVDGDNDSFHDSIVENYEKIYDEKLDGVLEYVGDIFDDLFDDDFDDFYEDIVDGDGYDDCFVKRYVHYFDDDFKSEVDVKYDEFDEFFKNYDRIKALTSRLSKQSKTDRSDDDDDDDDDDHNKYSNRGVDDIEDGHTSIASRTVYPKSVGNVNDDENDDKNDDLDENIWSGKGTFQIYENGLDSRSNAKPQDSRLFDFRKTLKQNGGESHTGSSLFDAFYEGLSKD